MTKLSISEASPAGGQELIVLGKNFVKDSRVVFTETTDGGATVWSQTVTPHKDHLQAVSARGGGGRVARGLRRTALSRTGQSFYC